MKPGGKPKEGQQSEKGPKKLRLGIGKMVKIGSGWERKRKGRWSTKTTK